MDTLVATGDQPDPDFNFEQAAAAYRADYGGQIAAVAATLRATTSAPVRLPQSLVSFLR